jgi:hypothetical protein
MGTFSGMKDAKRGYTSNRLTEGDYVVRVDRCDHFEAEAAGEGFKITLTVLAADGGKHKEGEAVTATYFLRQGSKGGKKQWFGNIKSFIAVVMNVEDERIDEAAVVRTLDPEQALAGTVCRVKSIARMSKTTKDEQGNPNEFYVYSWTPAMENEEIRQTLGAERVARFFPSGL